MTESERCYIHGDEIVWEPGGPDMPTIHGRHYCPTCQARMMAALNAIEVSRDE